MHWLRVEHASPPINPIIHKYTPATLGRNEAMPGRWVRSRGNEWEGEGEACKRRSWWCCAVASCCSSTRWKGRWTAENAVNAAWLHCCLEEEAWDQAGAAPCSALSRERLISPLISQNA